MTDFSILILACFWTPYVLGFTSEQGIAGFVLETSTDFIFLIDIVMNFHFAFINDKLEIVDDKKKIAS